MRKRELDIWNTLKRKKRITDDFTHQGVSQGRMKLTCDTPFLMVRNLSDYRFCCSFAFGNLRRFG